MSEQTDLIARLRFNDQGLVPVIAQQWDSGEVLMMAWMNQEALQITLETGQATYFSRSRSRLWVKGETSGNLQQVRSLRLDCDGDTILLEVDQHGVACHTGARSCFDTSLSAQQTVSINP
ncbi:MAG: phosphoribosyl-AMP cyclohydrolase [Actinobacteria bacterium]|uniref:Histidine biosynthesis bifunctional protein HisIE n=1 Tax=freshwater metagenome TaxID=449393 RepID=A0A6J7D1F4_9ZZZZ|nr:phosphoribosyl-AMP cyclohydrolase [Actinomycetota bacterium]MSY40867.1 phosphoribosyl-AMP cyclohydrolase [Actinomycetota bacterium]MSY97446.1 phosphoribosyl-AMP cyclohydrolase [Actinomycetota bacterium]